MGGLFFGPYGLRFGWFVTLICAAVAVFVMAILVGTNVVTRHYDRINCRQFAAVTNRPTKFVSYTRWSWECLTPAGDGKWIPTNQLRGIK